MAIAVGVGAFGAQALEAQAPPRPENPPSRHLPVMVPPKSLAAPPPARPPGNAAMRQAPATGLSPMLPPIWLEIPCGGSRYPARAVGARSTYQDGVHQNYLLSLPPLLALAGRAAPADIEICASPGWTFYQFVVASNLAQPSTTAFLWGPGGGPDRRGSIRVTAAEAEVPLHDDYYLRFGESGPDAHHAKVELKTVLSFPSQDGMPRPVGYKIPNYRPAGGGEIANEGILDPDSLDEQNAVAGIVFVEGGGLGADDIAAVLKSRSGEVGGEILERSPSRLKVRFPRVIPGSRLCLRRLGAEACLPAAVARLSYRAFGSDFFAANLGDLALVLGDNQNNGTMTAPGNPPQSFPIDAYRQAGFELRVRDLRSQPEQISVLRDGSAGAILRLTIPFETGGREVTGTFLRKISGWRCGTFKVSNEQCGGIDIPCFLRVVGSALSAAVSCLNPASWASATWDGPTLPVELDMAGPSVQLDLKLAARQGAVARNGAAATFRLSDLSGSLSGVPLPLGVLKDFFAGEINARLGAALPAFNLDEAAARPLNTLVHLSFSGRVAAVTASQFGTLFIDLRQD